MRHLLLFALIAGLVWACGDAGSEKTESTSSSTASAEKPAADAPDGKKIYKQYCIACHGLYGDMGASGAFNLQTSTLQVEERVAVITNGRNAMTPFKDLLSEEQIKAVAQYTLELKK